MKNFVKGICIALAVMVADQAVKYWIIGLLADAQGTITLTPFFNLVMVWNKGISFGMLSGHDAWLGLVIFTIGMIIALLTWLWRNPEKPYIYALGLVIGGAAGNLIDRLKHGAVADFFDFHLYGYHWPAFNIADSAIVIGVIIIGFFSFFGKSSQQEKQVL